MSDGGQGGDARLCLLAEVGAVLQRSLDWDETLDAIARLAVPCFADWSVIDLRDGEQLRRAAVAIGDPAMDAFGAELRAMPVGATSLSRAALLAGEATLIQRVTDEHLAQQGIERRAAGLARRMGASSLLIAPLPARGGPLGAISLVRGPGRPPFTEVDLDLAREIAARAGLALDNARLYREAHRALQAREDLLATVSHDLRNPLTTLRLNLRLLPALGADEASPLGRARGRIARAVEQMERLIDDLVDSAAIEAGRLSLTRATVPAADLLREAFEMAEPQAAAGGVLLVMDGEGEALVDCDRGRALQALGNLIGNAIKFSSPGGLVTLRLGLTDGLVRLAVQDSGPGVLPGDLPRLFDRYFTARRRDRGGTGLGLYIADGIARAHGGRIEVESPPGTGATFTLILPAS